jgi:hypothetical protein
MKFKSDITRTIFIPIEYYAFVLAPLCHWEIFIELDLITLEFYNYSEDDGVNLKLTGSTFYVDEAIEYFIDEINSFDPCYIFNNF